MSNKPNFKEYHFDSNGKKVAGTAHQVYKMVLVDPFVIIPNKPVKLVDPFVVK